MCSATDLDETSSTLPYVNETETCVEAFHTTDTHHGPDDRGLTINIGWDENVAIEVYSDGENEDIQECGELRSNHFICYACAEDRGPAPFAQSDDDISVILKDDIATVINGEGDASESRLHGTIEEERQSESS